MAVTEESLYLQFDTHRYAEHEVLHQHHATTELLKTPSCTFHPQVQSEATSCDALLPSLQ